MNKPWLIQRVDVLTHVPVGAEGLDAYFGFDYMGSSEFEGPTLYRALKKMREQSDAYSDEPKRIKDDNGRIAWYVGPEDKDVLAYVHHFFVDRSYANNCTMSFQERTRMHNAYEPRDGCQAPQGWWALDQEIPWLLFVEKVHAREWVTRMKASPL